MKRRALLKGAAVVGGVNLLGCRPPDHASTGDFVGPSVERGHALRSAQTIQAPGSFHKAQVLVLGGGVAGMAALRNLHAHGIDAALLELEASVGGSARGHSLGGMPCPIGAHYLPVPDAGAPHVQALLVDLGLAAFQAGRFVLTQAGEGHLCHSPQERVWHQGFWHDGLLPLADASGHTPPSTLAQVQRFAALVEVQRSTGRFVLPVFGAQIKAADAALDGMTFAQWLAQENITDTTLRQYLDYCCRDDYGAGLTTVSAWAGLHYFASRHGFATPGGVSESAGVLTWPQGNAWLVEAMAKPHIAHIHTGLLVARVSESKSGVEVDATDASGQVQRWQAPQAVLAMPLRVAARVLNNPSQALADLAKSQTYSAWVVSNLLLAESLETAHTHGGAQPAWDNVVFGTDSLGYVDASHQRIASSPNAAGPRVLTHYRALGTGAAAARTALDSPWTHWRDAILAELEEPHPDLPRKLRHTSVTRYGHAMAVPVPGVAASARTGALAQLAANGIGPRLAYAHSDLAGYSVFEEAYTAGVLVSERVARLSKIIAKR